jgi:hypothetical protein
LTKNANHVVNRLTIHFRKRTFMSFLERNGKMARTLTKHVARRQEQTFTDWFAELRELAGDRWHDVADQAPTVYAVWGGGATPQQALYMVGLILPPKVAA